MKRVRQEGTQPEMEVRRILHSLGGRYRVNVKNLPGSPDIANKGRGKAIFVHGCFWHFHRDCQRGVIPKTNRSFWEPKLRRNRERDERKVEKLREQGFDVMVVWECELSDAGRVKERLDEFWF